MEEISLNTAGKQNFNYLEKLSFLVSRGFLTLLQIYYSLNFEQDWSRRNIYIIGGGNKPKRLQILAYLAARWCWINTHDVLRRRP